jgi:hypothetical protein
LETNHSEISSKICDIGGCRMYHRAISCDEVNTIRHGRASDSHVVYSYLILFVVYLMKLSLAQIS